MLMRNLRPSVPRITPETMPRRRSLLVPRSNPLPRARLAL